MRLVLIALCLASLMLAYPALGQAQDEPPAPTDQSASGASGNDPPPAAPPASPANPDAALPMCSAEVGNPPHQPSIRRAPPTATPERQAIVGAWEGPFTSQFGTIQTRVIVEGLTPTGGVTGLYLWGNNPTSGTQAGGTVFNATGTREGRFEWGSNVKFTFVYNRESGTLTGYREQNGVMATGHLTRCQLP